MKIKNLILLCIVLMFGCKNDDIDLSLISEPRVLFMVDNFVVDMNAAFVPEIISVVQAEGGLSSVTQYVQKTGGVETPYESVITSFPNQNSYSISRLLSYTEDITGFRVEVIDKHGRKASATLPITVIPLRDAPQVVFTLNGAEATEVEYKEGSPMPIIKIKASSEEDLIDFAVSTVINRVESPLLIEGKDTIQFDPATKEYSIDLSVDGYLFAPKTTALKVYVSAGDVQKPKIKVGTLKVNYIEIPGPTVTFEDGSSKEINEFSNITVKAQVTAPAKVKEIKVYRMQKNGTTLLDEISLSPSLENYSLSIPITRIVMDDLGIQVEATDDNNKTTSFTLNFTVNELAPAPDIKISQAEDAFNGVDAGSNLFFTGTVTTLSDFSSADYVVFDNQGNEVLRTALSFSGKTIELNASNTNYQASNTTRKIGIEVFDINGKETKVYREVHVGYYFARVHMSLAGEDRKATSTTGPLPGPFFSAKNLKAMSYIEGKASPLDADIAFHAQSSYGAIRSGSMMYAKSSSKFTGHTKIDAGLDTWSSITNYTVKTVSSIAWSDFENTTIDDFSGLTFSGSSESPVIASGAFPNATTSNTVISYQTNINGSQKNVILAYDSFDQLTADKSASTFYIKVKVQK